MAYFADDPAIRKDMNDVRLNLAKVNPHGYTCPIEIQLSGNENFTEDLLPLYYCSSIVREKLEKIPERPTKSLFVVEGTTDIRAFKIVIAYSNGSSRAYNWVAQLAVHPELAAYVWELAVVYKIAKLEEFTREPAFDESSGSMNVETVVRLLINADHVPKYRDKALKFMCYNLPFMIRMPAEFEESYTDPELDNPEPSTDPCRDFGYLKSKDLKEVLTSVHLRATQEQRYDAIAKWHTQNPKKSGEEGPDEKRSAEFYKLTALIYYPLVSSRRGDILEYRDYNMEMIFGLAPRKADVRKYKGKSSFTAFKLDDLLGETKSTEDFYEPPRLKGLFKYSNYYWQLEVPLYSPKKSPTMGIYLRLLHGTDQAGSSIRKREIAGLMAKFIFRVHCSDNFDKCYRQSKCVHVDMMNLPAGHKCYGFRNFLGENACKFVLKLKRVNMYVSVEIINVREIAASR